MRFGLTKVTPARGGLWNPMEEIVQMQDMLNNMFKERSFGERWSETGILAPLVDVKDEGSELLVTTDLPGVEKGDVDLDVSDNMLTISANRNSVNEEKDEGYLRRERTYSSFSRTVTLPNAVSVEGAKAKLENGVLSVTLPKMQIEENKKILIE
ncbi:heat shock protein Hsp20 [Methanolobus vulcani]|jgi:Molecular chaperone (small heat shock protein)|uniref:Heat shock protein Hsp20 n=1 Tax=Methanolobus vulcani TaxID=38026 RepID=A0A7Z7FCP0_9EURY|nr:Hsp20/alpha crystallin family protein [Methanolobus vulcani]SDF82133.1 heat shock protein Hsp20 [Methanolobus vulcani]